MSDALAEIGRGVGATIRGDEFSGVSGGNQDVTDEVLLKERATVKTEHRERLLGAITDVFEKFGFMFVATEGDPPTNGGDEYLQASITFSGPARGEISIAASAGLSRQLAANALGVPPEQANGETGLDALKELVNLICGELTVALFGEEPVFDLGVPRVSGIDGARWRELYTNPQNVRVWADEAAVVGSLVVGGR